MKKAGLWFLMVACAGFVFHQFTFMQAIAIMAYANIAALWCDTSFK